MKDVVTEEDVEVCAEVLESIQEIAHNVLKKVESMGFLASHNKFYSLDIESISTTSVSVRLNYDNYDSFEYYNKSLPINIFTNMEARKEFLETYSK